MKDVITSKLLFMLSISRTQLNSIRHLLSNTLFNVPLLYVLGVGRGGGGGEEGGEDACLLSKGSLAH